MNSVISSALAGVAVAMLVPGPPARGLTGRLVRERSQLWFAAVLARSPTKHRGATAAEAARVVTLIMAVAAQLRSGRSPDDAWAQVIRSSSSLPSGLTHPRRKPAQVTDALRLASRFPGCHGLGRVAACWEAAEQSGAGLAEALSRLAATLREELDVHAEVTEQLAGPRATAMLLAALPLFALAMGQALGAEPFGVLLKTAYGWICLTLGVALSVAGWWWVERQVSSVAPWRDS